MADIIGEKRIHEGEDNLCRQLLSEENFFTAVSIMEALGKLRIPKAIPYILNWIQAKEHSILLEKQFFVLKHARIALTKLVNRVDDEIIIQFDQRYDEYLRDYFIL